MGIQTDARLRAATAPEFDLRGCLAMVAAVMAQVSLTDPDARSMATSGRGSGVVGYNVQVAVETELHLIVAHAVISFGLMPRR